VPSDFKENIKRNTDIIWVLDNYTASLPWELMHTGSKTEKPLCISAGMIRQLAISDFDTAIEVKNNNVIIIGDPNLEGLTKARQLPGAAREAKEVYDLFAAKKSKLNIEKPLVNVKSSEIFIELFKQDYKIVHIAAHGFFDGLNLQNTGIVVGKKKDSDDPILLTADHIKQLPATPELVFINSCFLGKINSAAEEFSANRHRLAANIGTQLIKMGVKAVVVAGWEVDDTAALAFAKKFYEEMLAGSNLGNAMKEARMHIHNNFGHTNTWGAFQCYGQPGFVLNTAAWIPHEKKFDIEELAENALEQLISKSEVPFYKADKLMEELKEISKVILDKGFNASNIKQLEAKAYRELGDYSTALAVYKEMQQSEKASFTVSSLESFYDVTIKKAMNDFYEAEKNKKADSKLLAATLTAIDKGINDLQRLVSISPTAERYSLIASAYKRKARAVLFGANNKNITMGRKNKNAELNKALSQSALYYFSAYQHKEEKDIYSFNNWLSLKTLTGMTKGNWKESFTKGKKPYSVPMSISKIKKYLKDAADKKSTAIDLYWDLSQETDVAFCNFYLAPGANTIRKLKEAFAKTWEKTGAKNKKQRQIDNIELYMMFATHFGKKTIADELDKLKKYLYTL
jgi:CHAT domain